MLLGCLVAATLAWSKKTQSAEPPPVTASEGAPVLRLWLDAPVEEVARLSTFRLPGELRRGIPGKEFITTPHVLWIDEPGFALRFDVAGNIPSLATQIGYSFHQTDADPPPSIEYFTVHPLPDYVRLDAVLAKAKEIRQSLLTQGFKEENQSVQNRFNAEWEAAPAGVDRFEGLEAAFLSTRFFAKSATAFSMTKGRYAVNLRLINGRRRWGSREDRTDMPYQPVSERIERELQRMTEEDLREESVYSLQFSVGPTNDWASKRKPMPLQTLEAR